MHVVARKLPEQRSRDICKGTEDELVPKPLFWNTSMWYFIIVGDHYSYIIKGEPTNRGAWAAVSPAVKGHLGSCSRSFAAAVMEHHDPGDLHMQRFLWASASRGMRVHRGGEAGQQEAGVAAGAAAESSHLES